MMHDNNNVYSKVEAWNVSLSHFCHNMEMNMQCLSIDILKFYVIMTVISNILALMNEYIHQTFVM